MKYLINVFFVIFVIVFLLSSIFIVKELKVENTQKERSIEIQQKQYDADTSFYNFQRNLYEEIKDK